VLATSSSERWSLALFGGIVTDKQDDLNSLITRANTRVGGISTPQFTNAYEIGAYIQRRITGSIVAIQVRPGYFFNSTTGTGGSGSAAGTYSYKVNGYSVMPLIKLYVLESKTVKLFIQSGIGWGTLAGEIQEAGATSKFSGNNFGFQGGVGVDWCFGSKSQHCLITEGNMRYMSIERNMVSETSGTFGSNSVSQTARGKELEIDSHDLATTMSGIQAIVGYKFAF